MAMRRIFIVWPVLCLILVALSLYFGRDQLARLQRPSFLLPGGQHTHTDEATDDIPKNKTLPEETITTYVDAIMQAETNSLPRLDCPRPSLSRYEYLAFPSSENAAEIQYFFALDLRECLPLLPRLIGSVVEAIRYLGPHHCALSIIEGNSPDGTADVLGALRPKLDALTTTYYFRSSDINPQDGDRIEKLAELRNMALQPMLDEKESTRYSTNTTIIFLNDVAICLEDILELVHQRQVLGADMTCAFDWTYVGPDPTFYDVWIARGMTGDSLFEIPSSGSWDSAWNLFWNDPDAKSRFQAHKPIQVFSCWNGATAFTAAPIVERKISFRARREDECLQGEPQLFCKDMWFHGHGKIAVIPSVNLEYSNEQGKKIKELKGYTSQWISQDGSNDDLIDWNFSPPEQVKCMPSWSDQYFEAWNKTLGS